MADMTLAGFKQIAGLLVSRRWWRTSLLVVAIMMIMAQLGFWQISRLEHRRARNASIINQLAADPLALSEASFDGDLSSLEYRPAYASGAYDHSREIILKGQVWRGQPGVHLITPLILSGSPRAVLVDRGWIPYDKAERRQLAQFAEPGPVIVTGLIRSSDPPPDATTTVTNTMYEYYRVDIATLQSQIPYDLLPVYLQQSPNRGSNINPPIRTQPPFELSEGRHLGYAIQWYLFVIVLGAGYLYYLRKNTWPDL